MVVFAEDHDLRIHDVRTWKYVDDTTITETIPRDGHSDVQLAVAAVEDWSCDNHMQLNADKCKEMIIDFKRNNHVFNHVNGKELSVVESVKILGLTVSSNLLWNNHVIEAIKKSNKRIFLLVLLKRAGVPEDIIFYWTTISPVLQHVTLHGRTYRSDVTLKQPNKTDGERMTNGL